MIKKDVYFYTELKEALILVKEAEEIFTSLVVDGYDEDITCDDIISEIESILKEEPNNE